MSLSDEHLSRALRHLMSWGTGRADLLAPNEHEHGSATLVLASAEHLDDVLHSPLTHPETVVLYPDPTNGSDGIPSGPCLAVPYDGEIDEPGSDVAVGDSFYLQQQDYGSSAFVSVIGPTLVRFFEPGDFEAYVADADRALETGEFPGFLVDPSVQIADQEAISGIARGDGPRTRLFVDADGALATAPAGLRFASLGDSWEFVVGGWADAAGGQVGTVQLGSVLDEEVRREALDSRPWLGRYLVASEALRRLVRLGIATFKVSGFAHRLGDDYGDADLTRHDLPVIAWSPQKAYVVTPQGRTFSVSLDFGTVLEAVLASGSVDRARTLAPGDLVDSVVATCAEHGVRLPDRWDDQVESVPARRGES